MHDDAVKMLHNIGAIVNVYQHERETPEEFAGRVGKYVPHNSDDAGGVAVLVAQVGDVLQQAAKEQFLGNDKLARERIADAYRAVLK